jgi:8-oxo-dGTP pyrophosphatase MutT (NUDIX family)
MLCNNCSKNGHVLHQCKLPIISCGVILLQQINNIHYYLMIRRKDSFGYIDFIYGKYNPNNLHQVQQKIDEMSIEEKKRLLSLSFDDLWKELWGLPINNVSSIYKNEAFKSKKKFELLLNGINQNGKIITLKHLIENSNTSWLDTEWEFPKGRKNYQEKDLDCALRECQEETGINIDDIVIIENILPFEELFVGSNHKCYKHKYFVAILNNNNLSVEKLNYQTSEVSKLEWKTFEECLSSIRPYHIEKKKVLTNVHKTITENIIYR